MLEWSVLDAQWFGLAQRRKRVFAIVDFGDWTSRPPILLERESLRGDSAPSRETRQDFTADARASTYREGSFGQFVETQAGGTVKASGGCLGGGSETLAVATGDCYTLTTNDRHAVAYPNVYLESNQNDATTFGGEKPCTTLVASMGMGGGYVPMVARYEPTVYCGTQNDALRDLGIEICPTLRAGHGGGAVNPMVVYGNKNRDDMVETCYNKGINHNGDNYHGSTQETNANKILRALRKEVGEEAFTQWGLGVSYSFLEKEVLRPLVHGKGIRCETIEGGHKVVNSALSRKKACAEGQLCELWQAGRERRTPQRWGLEEQCRRELGAHLSQLPQQGASNKTFMRDMWHASEGIGILREALSEIQEIRRPYVDESKSAHASYTVRRLTPKEAERLQGFSTNFTKIPYRNKSVDDCPNGVRYKALGNSMAVNVMAWIGQKIQQTQGVKVYGAKTL